MAIYSCDLAELACSIMKGLNGISTRTVFEDIVGYDTVTKSDAVKLRGWKCAKIIARADDYIDISVYTKLTSLLLYGWYTCCFIGDQSVA